MAANDGPRLVIDKGPDVGRNIALSEGSTVLGRTEEAQVRIEFFAVSRQHARISKEDDVFYVEDLGSRHGTFLNGERIDTRVPLGEGDQIGLGPSIHLTFHRGASVASQGPATPSDTPAETAQSVKPPPAASEHVEQEVEDHAVSAPVGATAVSPSIEGRRFAPTTVEELPSQADMEVPPVLRVTVAGENQVEHTLQAPVVTLGREAGNDIVIPSPIVSRKHARLERTTTGYQVVVEPEASNPTMMDGRPIQGSAELHHGTLLRIGGRDPGSMVTMEYVSPAEAAAPAPMEINFANRSDVQIGRGADNDVVLDAPSVSRYHARVERIGKRFRVQDFGSTNGTYVNGTAIDDLVWLNVDDEVRIGPYRFRIGEESLEQHDDSSEIRVEVRGLNKWVRKDLNILKNLSLVLQPREFVVVVGQSGGGKSTFVDAVAGYRPATHGQVMVNNVDVYRNFDSIRSIIGYVPQKDIIHSELTVYEALDYAAQLRMPADTTKAERHARIMEVLDDLDIAHRKDVRISGLSGGQQKRVSIGVELLTKPSLFFLDEPSSGLDPGTETALMQLMRRLADQGRTITLITHATKNVLLADKVIFLARGGYLAWFGPPDEALDYFDQFRSERDRRTGPMAFDDIYALLADPALGEAPDWAERYQATSAYQTYVVQPLQSGDGDLSLASAAERSIRPVVGKVGRKVSSLKQFMILSARNLRILTRDRFSLGLMLAAAPIVGMLDIVLAVLLGRSPFDFVDGNVGAVLVTMFLLAVYGVMVGALSQMREFVKEGEIYRRERLVNLKILPYVLSKVWVAGLFALYQAAAYTIIHYLAFDMPGGVLDFFLIYITLALATMAGMMLGLFASALSPSPNAAPMLVIIFIIPQIVLGGAVIPLPPAITTVTSTGWAFRAFMNITGAGSDVAADVCYALPEDQRLEMTTEAKLEAGCKCVGPAALKKENCNFPAVGSFYDPVIDTDPPAEPPPPPDKPADPVLPDPPPEPEDQSDAVAVADYLDKLEAYQAEVESIQSQTEADFAAYESELKIYQAKVTTFQQDRIAWQLQREAAIKPAEVLMSATFRDFGWTFVNKQDGLAYWSAVVLAWSGQAAIIGILIVGILVMVKRKDVN